MRIIVDTNIWISYLITHRFTFIDQLLLSGKVRIVFSEELLEEFITVAQRPKFARFFTVSDLSLLMELLEDYSEIVKVTSQVTVCRDPKDNFLLALAKDSEANYLISGDQDLLEIGMFQRTRIISPSTFTQLFD